MQADQNSFSAVSQNEAPGAESVSLSCARVSVPEAQRGGASASLGVGSLQEAQEVTATWFSPFSSNSTYSLHWLCAVADSDQDLKQQ